VDASVSATEPQTLAPDDEQALRVTPPVLPQIAPEALARRRRPCRRALPRFDDDPVVSVILGEAFVLVDDTAISARTILAQVKGS